MPAGSTRLFPCRVFPGTAARAQAKAHGVAVLIVIVLSMTLAKLQLLCMGIPLTITATGLTWLTNRRNKANRVVEFVRQFEFHCGNNCPSDAIRPLGPFWLALILPILLSIGVMPGVRPAIAYGLLTVWLVIVCKRMKCSFPSLLREHWNCFFVFLGHPDRRYVSPAGIDAMWIPNDSMLRRRLYVSSLLLPFYLGLAAGLQIGAEHEQLQGNRGLADLVLLLPVPFLAVLALHAHSLQLMRSQTRTAVPDFQFDWESCVQRVRESTHHNGMFAMADHFFLGFALPTREQARHPLHTIKKWDLPSRVPVLVHESSMDGHVHMVGPTGINKTTIGQVGIAIQAVRGRTVPERDPFGNLKMGFDGEPITRRSEPEPMLVIDLKGDLSLFNTFKEECARSGQTFRFMTLQRDKATSFFNPLRNLQRGNRPIIEFCEIVLNALDLFHGALSYGSSYFSEQCRNLLLETLKALNKPVDSWEQLFELLTEALDRRKHRDAYELLGRIYGLSQYPVLGSAPEGIDAIHMPDVIERGECVYLWLPALIGAMSVTSIAKLAMFCYLDAAAAHKNSGKARKKSWVFVDEAQVVCGQNIERIFQQASGCDIRLVFSNQSVANLDTRDAPNFSGTVWDNCRIKQGFALLSTRDREDWIKLSGEAMDYIPNYNSKGETSWQGVVHPRLNHDAINAIGNTPGASLLYLIRDTGLSRLEAIPRQIWCPFPMSKAEYDRRLITPWPELPETRTQAGIEQTTVVNTQSPQEIENRAAEKYAAIDALFAKIHGQSGRREPPPIQDQ
jgi:hypothetical protein